MTRVHSQQVPTSAQFVELTRLIMLLRSACRPMSGVAMQACVRRGWAVESPVERGAYAITSLGRAALDRFARHDDQPSLFASPSTSRRTA